MSGRVSKMMAFLHWRMKVTLADRRVLIGSLLAFDRHMNLVLADCEEVRTIKAKKTPTPASTTDTKPAPASTASSPADDELVEQKRTLGLVLGFALGAVNLYYILQIVERDIAGMRLDYFFPVGVALALVPTILAAAFIAALWPAESAVRGSLVEALEYE